MVSGSSENTELEIRHDLWEAKKNNILIKLGWIPSHTSIKGNEMADTLAKKSLDLDHINFNLVEYRNILPNIKSDIYELWEEEWRELCVLKGQHLYRLLDHFPKKPWFSESQLNKSKLSTYSRLRIGHCYSKDHLNRIGLVESPLCDCGAVANLNHIFFECAINKGVRDKFYIDIIKCFNPLAMVLNLNCILRETADCVVLLVCKFLKDINCKL